MNQSNLILSGLKTHATLLDNVTVNPFSTLVLTDYYAKANQIAHISFVAANGILSGTGLTAGVVNNGIVSYTLSAGSATDLESALQNLIFIPTIHQVTTGQIVNTTITLSIADSVSSYKPFQALSSGIAEPWALAVDSQGQVWVANATNNTVEHFSGSGALLQTIRNGLAFPDGVVIDAQNNIWIANALSNSLEKFSNSGILLQTVTSGIANPSNLATDSQGNVWVTNKDNNSIEQFSSLGGLLSVLNFNPSDLQSIAIDNQGHLWIGNGSHNSVEERSNTGALLQTLSDGVSDPGALAIDSLGNLWVSNYGNHTVEEFSTSGVLMHTLTTGNLNPLGIATDTQNNVWLGYSNNTISGFSPIAITNAITDQSTQIYVTSSNTAPPVLAAVSYDAQTGKLSLYGNYLTSQSSDFIIGALTLTGQNGLHYTLTGGIVEVTSSNQITFDLSSADQLTVNTLLNKSGNKAFDNTLYNLSLNAGWDKGAGFIGSQALTVNNVVAPVLTGASYNIATGLLTVTGNHLASFGNQSLNFNSLLLKSGSHSYHLTNGSDKLSDLTANGFKVTLATTDRALVNDFFNTNGTRSGFNAYNLSVGAGWDTLISSAIGNLPITVEGGQGIAISGFTTNNSVLDTQTIQPFGSVIPVDSYANASETATISFAAANGTLSDAALSNGVVNKGLIYYTLSAASANSLQQALQKLVFTPTTHQVAVGETINTTINLSVVDNVSPYSAPFRTLPNSVAAPLSLATDTQGHLWVAISDNDTVKEFTIAATGFMKLALNKANGLLEPYSIAADNRGNVWIANSSSSSVQQFSDSGILLQTLTKGISNPSIVVCDSFGHLWIGNKGNNTVQEFSVSGTLLNTLTEGIVQPLSLATDSQDNVWVGNGIGKVEEFSASGQLLNLLTQGINQPACLATDYQGNVWVANINNLKGYIEEFSSSGKLLNTLINGVDNPVSLITDHQGNIWIANKGNSTVEEFSSSGVLLHSLSSGISVPVSLVIDSQGTVWVGNSGDNSVAGFSSSILSHSAFYDSTHITVTATSNSIVIDPTATISNPTVISNAHIGDQLKIQDALSFNAKAITASSISAQGGGVSTLAGWVSGILSTQGANEASHNIDWFNFKGNTYLLEQAHAQGSVYSAGDSLIELVGIWNENAASFNNHVLTLA